MGARILLGSFEGHVQVVFPLSHRRNLWKRKAGCLLREAGRDVPRRSMPCPPATPAFPLLKSILIHLAVGYRPSITITFF